MEITYLGRSCFRIKGKSVVVVCDPFGEKVGKFPKDVTADIVTVSHDHFDHNATDKVGGSWFLVRNPGEYEVKGVSIVGVHSWHDDKDGSDRGPNTIYVIEIDGLRVCHVGDLGHKLTQVAVDEIGTIDVVMVPVGGVYTIDAKVACEVVKQLDPWVVIPMHYGGEDLAPVEDFWKEMGVGSVESVSKFAMTPEKLPTELTVVLLDKKA